MALQSSFQQVAGAQALALERGSEFASIQTTRFSPEVSNCRTAEIKPPDQLKAHCLPSQGVLQLSQWPKHKSHETISIFNWSPKPCAFARQFLAQAFVFILWRVARASDEVTSLHGSGLLRGTLLPNWLGLTTDPPQLAGTPPCSANKARTMRPRSINRRAQPHD